MTAAQLRKQCEIASDDTTHDDQLSRLAAKAVREFERYTRRALITQTWQFDTKPRNRIELPRPPLISVSSVQMLTEKSTYTTLATSDYAVSAGKNPGSIRMIESWPSWYEYEDYPVRIVYTAGYGTDADDVPDDYKEVILQMVAFDFAYRGDATMGWPMQIKAALDGMRSGTMAGYFNERI